jgi:hypothetical protein
MKLIKMPIRTAVIAAATIVMFGCIVGWSWAEFENWRARLEPTEVQIASASGDEVPTAPATLPRSLRFTARA